MNRSEKAFGMEMKKELAVNRLTASSKAMNYLDRTADALRGSAKEARKALISVGVVYSLSFEKSGRLWLLPLPFPQLR